MNLKHIFNQIKYYLKIYGIRKTIKRCSGKVKNLILGKDSYPEADLAYQQWIQNNEPTDKELENQRNHEFKIKPKFSIIVPMYETPERFFLELVDCVKNQTYSNWELCLADGSPEKNEKLISVIENEEKIKYNFLNENKGISGNTNEALKLATGDYIVLLDHDDLLPVFCLYELAKCINENSDVEFIYSDEDHVGGEDNHRFAPYFKSDLAIDTLRSNNYITHLSAFKKELMTDKIGGFREEFNGAQDYDVIIRAVENTENIVHIPKILYHWRIHQNSTAFAETAKPYAYEAGKKVIEEHLKRQNIKAKVEPGGDIPGIYKVDYEIIGNPSVSILIPNKDHGELLEKCIESILNKTTYRNYEIIVIDNNSVDKKTFDYYKKIEENEKIRILKYKEKEFNYSKIINFGVKNSNSDYILQLNNNTELITSDWLEKFIGYCQREDVGAVRSEDYILKMVQYSTQELLLV